MRFNPFLITLNLFVSSFSLAEPKNFAQAKQLVDQIYFDNKTELYCGCEYTNKVIDLASCGYVPRKNETRAKKIE